MLALYSRSACLLLRAALSLFNISKLVTEHIYRLLHMGYSSHFLYLLLLFLLPCRLCRHTSTSGVTAAEHPQCLPLHLLMETKPPSSFLSAHLSNCLVGNISFAEGESNSDEYVCFLPPADTIVLALSKDSRLRPMHSL